MQTATCHVLSVPRWLTRHLAAAFFILSGAGAMPARADGVGPPSIAKTGHLVVADTSWALYGFAAELAAIAVEKGFADLKAPVKRVTVPDCPAPVTRPLEDAFHPTPMTIVQACLELLQTDAATRRHVADVQASFAGPY